MDLDLRCVIANKFSLACYTTFLGSLGVLANNIFGGADLPKESYLAVIPFFLAPTFGYAGVYSTRKAYIESREVIENHGRTTSHLEKQYDYYCGRTGLRMAIRDLTLEGVLDKN